MTPPPTMFDRLRPLVVVVALLSLVALSTSSLSAQGAVPGLTPGQVARIEKLITSEMAAQGIPGVSIAIVTDLQLRWATGYGMADLENFVPATASTNYRLASIGKSVTATGVMQLAEAGKLDLDAPIQRYVPTFPQKKWPVTARQLLYHVAGVRTYKPGEMESTKYFPTLTEALTMFKDDPLEFEPGTKYLYSTQGYTLLAVAIEGASGMNYYDYVQKHVFEPAGMDSTQADRVAAIIPHRAQGYMRLKEGGELRNSGLADTSNKAVLCSTVVDLAKFAVAFLSGKLVKSETVTEMWTVHPVTQRPKIAMGFGMGFNVSWRGSKPGEGEKEVYKAGNQQRVTGLLYMRPERKCVVALLFNLEDVGHGVLIARQISDITLDQAPVKRP
ncbi:MAG: beta-lactamase family protein [Acidobacteria bacterium]|nr:beta-lactamase family protein [Acidobacteriota bacterium]